MLSYCLKCEKNTESKNPKVVKQGPREDSLSDGSRKDLAALGDNSKANIQEKNPGKVGGRGGRGPGDSTPTPFVEGPVKTKNWKNDAFIKIGIKKIEQEATRILT